VVFIYIAAPKDLLALLREITSLFGSLRSINGFVNAQEIHLSEQKDWRCAAGLLLSEAALRSKASTICCARSSSCFPCKS
jgi:hypothetical protein